MIFLHTGCKFSEEWECGFATSMKNLNLKFTPCNVLQLKKVNYGDFLLGRYNESCLDIKYNFSNISNMFDNKTWPDKKSMQLYNDKKEQIKLFAEQKIPHPPSLYINNYSELPKWEFPFVCKKSYGSSSSNVFMAYSKDDIKFPCIIQKFCENNDYDIRITVIGHRILGFKRNNRSNDFRASGSGLIEPLQDLPKQCVEIAYTICKNNNFHTMCFDFVKYNDEYVILEISYTFSASAIIKNCNFFIDMNTNAKNYSLINPQKWVILDLFCRKTFI